MLGVALAMNPKLLAGMELEASVIAMSKREADIAYAIVCNSGLLIPGIIYPFGMQGVTHHVRDIRGVEDVEGNELLVLMVDNTIMPIPELVANKHSCVTWNDGRTYEEFHSMEGGRWAELIGTKLFVQKFYDNKHIGTPNYYQLRVIN